MLALSCWYLSDGYWTNLLSSLSGTGIYTWYWGKLSSILYRCGVIIFVILILIVYVPPPEKFVCKSKKSPTKFFAGMKKNCLQEDDTGKNVFTDNDIEKNCLS